MVDWGLLALLLIVLVLVFLAFHAWRGIKGDADRISATEARVQAKVDSLAAAIETARATAKAAHDLAAEVQGTHYKTLLRRIDEAEAVAAGFVKQVDTLTEKNISLAARLSAVHRWAKDVKAEAESPQEEIFPAAYVPPPGNVQVNGHFGRAPSRKVG